MFGGMPVEMPRQGVSTSSFVYFVSSRFIRLKARTQLSSNLLGCGQDKEGQGNASLYYLLCTLKLSPAGHQSGGQDIRSLRHRVGVDPGLQRRL